MTERSSFSVTLKYVRDRLVHLVFALLAMFAHFVSKLCFASVGVLMAEGDMTSLEVLRAGFVPPLVDDTVTVTQMDKATSDLLQQDKEFYQADILRRVLHNYEHDDNEDTDDDDDDDDDDDSLIFVAQQTTADNNCLYQSVSFALTGTSMISNLITSIKMEKFKYKHGKRLLMHV